MLQLSEFVWTLRSSILVVFNNFILIDATDRSKISSDHQRIYLFPFNVKALLIDTNNVARTNLENIEFIDLGE